MAEAGIANNKERAVKLLDISSMLKRRNYKVQVAVRLTNCLWRHAYTILNTEAGPNIIKLNAVDSSRKVAIGDVERQGLYSAAGTPLRVIGSSWLVTETGQRVNDAGSLVVKS